MTRPELAWQDSSAQEAVTAVGRLVAELQLGWDEGDADITNRHFANDIMWGSPFGATVDGYETLHAIHTRLKAEGRGGPSSRFELVRALTLTPDVVVAQIRRSALDAQGRPIEPSTDVAGPFSEMALYVLVRRDGDWWVAAGQNTPVRQP
jgi:uncharacterized protein (TIGR02246 family)